MSINHTLAVSFLTGLSLDPKVVSSQLTQRELPKDGGLNLLLRASGVRSQGEFAALVIELTEGQIDSEDMTEALAAAFPEAKIGTRHGPHYLCLARTGKLAGTNVKPPKATRKSLKDLTPAERVSKLEAQLKKARGEVKTILRKGKDVAAK